MFYNDHSPAHFHAAYGEFEALMAVDTLETIAGQLPSRATARVLEWASLHRTELRTNWDKARQGLALDSIDPDVLYSGLTPAWMEQESFR
jgi:hypothetical protein